MIEDRRQCIFCSQLLRDLRSLANIACVPASLLSNNMQWSMLNENDTCCTS